MLFFTKIVVSLIPFILMFSRINANADSTRDFITTEAEQGNTDAQFSLGCKFYEGEDVAKDAVEAVKWFRMAAEQGHVGAQIYLGIIYYEGEGVEKNVVEAYALYKLASVRNEIGLKKRDEIAKEMTPEQIAAGEKRVMELRKEFKSN